MPSAAMPLAETWTTPAAFALLRRPSSPSRSLTASPCCKCQPASRSTPACRRAPCRTSDAFYAQTDEDVARNVAPNPDAAPLLGEAETAAAIARSLRQQLGIS